MSKPTNLHVHPAKTQMSLGFHPVWSQSSLCARWIAKERRFLRADSEDSDQTGQMPRLIWVFTGHTDDFVGFVIWHLISFYSWNLYCKEIDENSTTRRWYDTGIQVKHRKKKNMETEINIFYLSALFLMTSWHEKYMGLVMRKRVLCHTRTTKAQISLRIRAVWSAPLISLLR